MARFEIIRDPAGNPALTGIYADIVANGFAVGGAATNWFTSQAIRPDILSATWTLLKAILIEGKLPHTLKQMIALTLSIQNDCRYCSVAHRGALEAMGVPHEVIESALRDPDMHNVPPAQRVVLRFALKVARTPKEVTEDDYAALQKAGFGSGEVMEIVMMAALNQFLNTWADASAIPLDSAAENNGT